MIFLFIKKILDKGDRIISKRKILILLFILTIVVGFAMASVSSVSATKKTAKFKDTTHIFKNIGYGDTICLFSAGKYGYNWNFDFAIDIRRYNHNGDFIPKHALTKAKIKFVKKEKVKYRVNGKIKTKWKNKYMAKTFKADKYGDIINHPPNRVGNGWKPYSAVVYYKKI